MPVCWWHRSISRTLLQVQNRSWLRSEEGGSLSALELLGGIADTVMGCLHFVILNLLKINGEIQQH